MLQLKTKTLNPTASSEFEVPGFFFKGPLSIPQEFEVPGLELKLHNRFRLRLYGLGLRGLGFRV